jgi:hypothetical protein
MEPESSLPYSQVPATCPLDCFVSRRSISTREYFLTWVFTGKVVSTSPNSQSGGPPHVGCPRLLIQYIRSYPPYRRPFLYPQPEDAPCRGDRDPLNTDYLCLQTLIHYLLQICFYHQLDAQLLYYVIHILQNKVQLLYYVIHILQNKVTVHQVGDKNKFIL